jgi:uncharacterized protein (TIGR02594 family)
MNYKVTGDVNIHSGPGTNYDIIGTANKDDIIIGVDSTGWTPIVLEADTEGGESVGWVSSKYVQSYTAPVTLTPTPVPTPAAAAPMAQAVSYFVSQGWTANQAAGLVGNLMQECDLNPAAVNPSSGATGIAQWLGSRLTQLQTYPNWQSLQTQLTFVNWELNNSEKLAGDALRQTTTLADATMSVRTQYERCGESEANDVNRLAQATIAYGLITPAVTKPVAVPAPPAATGEPVWITWAKSKLGFKEGTNDAEINTWFQYTTLAKSMWDCEKTAWCAVFANAALFINGIQGDRDALALDFLNWGTPVTVPKIGNIVVYDWSLIGRSGHHVNFFLKDLDNGYIQAIGGNQGTVGAVTIDACSKAAIMGYRRPV